MNYKRLTVIVTIVLLWLGIYQRKGFGMKQNYIKTKRMQATEYTMEIAQNSIRMFRLFQTPVNLKHKNALNTGGMAFNLFLLGAVISRLN